MEWTSDVLAVASLLMGSENSARGGTGTLFARTRRAKALWCAVVATTFDEVCRLGFAPHPNLGVDTLTALNEEG